MQVFIQVKIQVNQRVYIGTSIAKCELIHESFRSVSDPILASFKTDLTNMSLLGSALTPGPELYRKLEEWCADLLTAIWNLASRVDRGT